jgi:non-specific protein-tyrosine kinase
VNQDRSEISFSVADLARFVLRGALPALLVAAAVAAAVYVFVGRQPAVFQAEATLLVARTTTGFAQFGLTPVTAPPIELGAYSVAATSDGVLTDALNRLGNADPTTTQVRSLRAAVVVGVRAGARDTSLLRVEGRGGSAATAVDRANAVARALAAWDDQRSSETITRVIATLESQIEALSEQVRTLQTVGGDAATTQIDGLVRLRAEQQQQLAYARALVASAQGSVSVLQVADTTVRQVAPRPVMTAAIAALLAVVAVYVLMLVRVAFNTRLRGPDDIVSVGQLQVLAEFPTTSRVGDLRLREAANYLRASLLLNSEEARPRTFMITSSVDGEGKSTIAAELAESFARYGYRTLLIDADLRSPSVLERFPQVQSLESFATTEAWLSAPRPDQRMVSLSFPDGEQLYVLPQVRPVANASEILGRHIREALGTVRDFDVIVIDTPPILAVADALMIAPHCTGTVLVVDTQRIDRRKLLAAADGLRRIGVPLIGAVANRVATSGGGTATYGGPYGGPNAERPVARRQVPASEPARLRSDLKDRER